MNESHPLHARTCTIALLCALALPAAGCLQEQKKKGGGEPVSDGAVADPELGTTDFVSADGFAGQGADDAAGRSAGGGGSDGGEDGGFAEGAPQPAADPQGDGDLGANGGEGVVEEGDIYRVLGDGLLLNLNSYRGLQIIDVSDPATPEIIGRHQVTGEPVELYALGDRAIVLINNWTGFYGVRGAALPQQWSGGLVLDVDLSDPRRPTVVSREQVPGHIRKSRLVRQGDAAALYVVADESGAVEGENGEWMWRSATVAKSFDLAGGALQTRSELDLGGNIVDIQATADVLMIARTDWERDNGRSTVALVDISSPDGVMVQGGEVQALGQINSQFNMDFYNRVLRVVSDGRWNGDNINHVQTFDATDLAHPEAIDEARFGRDENLYATLFLGNKAFFVTFRRTDPFHAFEIDDDGNITERAEFVVTGWNDFFRPALGATRLVGIGVGDDRGQAQAVSLYDITDLDNAEPLIARAGVDAEHSWSEAQYDHRAFSVLEGVVEADGPQGALETGMVLLPFSGWDEDGQRYRSGVQIFTFSADSLTRRGVMEHGTPVRRSFQISEGTPGNLSEEELSLFDATDPDAPAELGRVELAPAYSDFLPFGESGARLKDTTAQWSWWGDPRRMEQPSAVIEIVALADDPDTAEALATIEAPAGARLHRIDEAILAVVTTRYRPKEQSPEGPTLETIISLYDLSDGAAPEALGSLTTRDIPEGNTQSWGFGRGGGRPDIGRPEPAFDEEFGGHFWYGNAFADVRVAGDSLVFVERRQQRRLLGNERICNLWPNEPEARECFETGPDGPGVPGRAGGGGGGGSAGEVPPDASEPPEPQEDGEFGGGDERRKPECSWLNGGITCRSLNDGPEVCGGQIQRCGEEDGQWSCVDVDEDEVQLQRDCWDNELYRYWQSVALHVVDLSNPARPTLAGAVELDDAWEAVSVLADGDSVYATWKAQAQVDGDARPFVRYHFTRVDLSTPGEPRIIDPVNIPGELLAVAGDAGDTLFTRDLVFGEQVIETAVNRLTLTPRGARLDARRRFTDEQVDTVALDGRDHLLVSHRHASQHGGGIMEGDVAVSVGGGVARGGGGAAPPSAGTANATETSEAPMEHEGQRLSVLNASADGGLAVLSEVPIADWAQLQSAQAGKALFSVGAGLLVVDLANPAQPEAQAYFPTRGWPSRIHVDPSAGQAYVPAGRYGVYRFDLDVRNLLALE